MSTHAITVSEPSTALATLRALAVKTVRLARDLIHRLRVTITSGGQVVATTAASALALIASDAGYELARSGIGAATRILGSLLSSTVRTAGRAASRLGTLLLRPLPIVSPATADSVAQIAENFVAAPCRRLLVAAHAWIREAGRLVAHLTGTALVRTATVKAAQIAGAILGVHALTEGLLAAKIVTALPWTMTAVVWATQPLTAGLLVGATFLVALAVAAARIWTHRPDPDADPVHDPDSNRGEVPALMAGPRPEGDAPVDLRAIAALLHVEVATDGSVLVHGIPDDLPEDIALEVAHTAADAATRRLQKLLLSRPIPNRDDRRLLTKTAREAVRRRARLAA